MANRFHFLRLLLLTLISVSMTECVTSCDRDEDSIQGTDDIQVNLTLGEVTNRSLISQQLNSSFNAKVAVSKIQKLDSISFSCGFLIAKDSVSIPLDYEHSSRLCRGDIMQGKVCYVECFSDISSGSMSYDFYTLQPGQKYKYRSFMIIGDDEFYSDISEFTEFDASDIDLKVLPADIINLFEMQLNATISSEKFNLLKLDILGYRGIVFSLSPNSPLEVNDAIWLTNHHGAIDEEDTYYYITDNLEGNEFNCRVNRLPACKEIYCRSFVLINGMYIYSDPISAKTSDVSRLQLATLPAAEIGLISARLKATHCHSELDQYKWDYGFNLGFVYAPSSSILDENLIKKSWTGADAQDKGEVVRLLLTKYEDVFETTIFNLKPESTYFYRSFIQVGNEWAFGEIMSFTTQKLFIETLPAFDITYNHAYLNIGVSDNVKELAISIDEGIVLSTDGSQERLVKENGEQFWTSSPIENGKVYYTKVPFTTSPFFVNGLRPETTYYYRAFVVINGIYYYGGVRSFTTEARPELVNKFTITGYDGWELRPDGSFVSTNHEHSSYSLLRATYNYEFGDCISFDWTVSSQEYCDELIILINGVQNIRHSGKKSGTFKKNLYTSGVANIEIKFVKDEALSSDADEATIKFTCYDMD